MLVFFTNLSVLEFWIRYLALLRLCSVTEGFECFWMGSPHKNIPLMLEFLKVPFLALHFSFYNTFIIISFDDTSLYSKCDQSFHLWQQLEMVYEPKSEAKPTPGLRNTVGWYRKWFVHFKAGKTQLVSFDRSYNTGAIDVKLDGSVLDKKSFFKMLGLSFSSKLDWGSYIMSIVKTASKQIRALIRSMKFLSPELALYLCKSSIRPCVEYCCHVWAGNPSCYLDLLDKLQKRICKTVGHSLAASLEPLVQRQNLASLFFSIDVHLNWLNWFHFLILEGGLLVILIDCMVFLSPLLDVIWMSMSTVSFLAHLGSEILFS